MAVRQGTVYTFSPSGEVVGTPAGSSAPSSGGTKFFVINEPAPYSPSPLAPAPVIVPAGFQTAAGTTSGGGSPAPAAPSSSTPTSAPVSSSAASVDTPTSDSPIKQSDLPGYRNPYNPANAIPLLARGVDLNSALAREASEYQGGAGKGGGAAAYFKDVTELKRPATAGGLLGLQEDISRVRNAARDEALEGYNFSSVTGYAYDLPVGAGAPNASVVEPTFSPNFNPNFSSAAGEVREVSYTFQERPVESQAVAFTQLSPEERNIEENKRIRELVRGEFKGLPLVGSAESFSEGLSNYADVNFRGGDVGSQVFGGVLKLGAAVSSPYAFASPFLETGLFVTSRPEVGLKEFKSGVDEIVKYGSERPIELGIQIFALPIAVKGLRSLGKSGGALVAEEAGVAGGRSVSSPRSKLVFLEEAPREPTARSAAFERGFKISEATPSKLEVKGFVGEPETFKGLELNERGVARLSDFELAQRKEAAAFSARGELIGKGLSEPEIKVKGFVGEPETFKEFRLNERGVAVLTDEEVARRALEARIATSGNLKSSNVLIPTQGIDRPGYGYFVNQKKGGGGFTTPKGNGGSGGGKPFSGSGGGGIAVSKGGGQQQILRFRDIQPQAKQKRVYFDVPAKAKTRDVVIPLEKVKFVERQASKSRQLSFVIPKQVQEAKQVELVRRRSVTGVKTLDAIVPVTKQKTREAQQVQLERVATKTSTSDATAFLYRQRTEPVQKQRTLEKQVVAYANPKVLDKALTKTLQGEASFRLLPRQANLFPRSKRLPVPSQDFAGKGDRGRSVVRSSSVGKYSPSFVGLSLGKTVSGGATGNAFANALGVRFRVRSRGRRR